MIASGHSRSAFESQFDSIFSELGEFQKTIRSAKGTAWDLELVSEQTGRPLSFHIDFRERITPQIADQLFERVRQEHPDPQVTVVMYAPVVSPRVAEMARAHGISYLDYAGNCRIINPTVGLFVYRVGIPNAYGRIKESIADPFSAKSSRIVRLMLHEPTRGWQVSELANHPEVDVSLGLVSKVKKALVHENYTELRDHLLYLKQPAELLRAWERVYPGAGEERRFYVRGEVSEIEANVAQWCEDSHIDYALARFSAAWQLQPEVRYSVASIYVDPAVLQAERLASFQETTTARDVESGANLVLLTPYDRGVFSRRITQPVATTSPLQTYLDLATLKGRGREAADVIYAKYLHEQLEGSPEDERT